MLAKQPTPKFQRGDHFRLSRLALESYKESERSYYKSKVCLVTAWYNHYVPEENEQDPHGTSRYDKASAGGRCLYDTTFREKDSPHTQALYEQEMAFVQKRYYYRDFENTSKIHYTRCQFVEWQRGGILNAVGAVFLCQTSALFIPKYLLLKDTLELLPEPTINEEEE